MSKKYRDSFKNKKPTRHELRQWLCPSFPKNEDGSPRYVTEQGKEKECDVNLIMKKYEKEKVITHINDFVGQYGDLTGDDFKSHMDNMTACRASFDGLPSTIRKHFGNNPENLLRFLEDERNRTEAAALGLLKTPQDQRSDAASGSTPPGEK